ncbi:ABC-2 transporter permease [Clostridium autoethanogenum]|uniref:ABC-2 transporter permease n=1 Tax=Clostridium autoethanogenum DSM 10061 TaxID=1341692 RepID=A0ABM5NTB0_9CLOT|nr:ABC-2 transporter permease [Clostridium autoethanogenum]AGY75660.1 ABC-2 transporter permease [Clostridium autoethanogenum DSM 10061]ALU35824.1 ABC-2 membrane transporter-like protein [Clostridium autoethanogenum DSM 10061]OVY52117.1 ABC-2 family transporter protein [Clostridium autoethanogenum]
MNGLILKDLYNLKNGGGSLLIAIVVFSLIYFLQGDNDNMEVWNVFIILLGSILVVNTMSYDNTAKWDKYALTMPVTRRDVVLSKYMVSIIVIFMGAVLATALSFAQGINKHNLDVIKIFTVNGAAMAGGLFFISVTLPVIYEFGVEKSRIVIFLVFLAPAGVAIGSSKLRFSPLTVQYIHIILQYLPVVLLLITILAMLISYSISLKIYSNKDM